MEEEPLISATYDVASVLHFFLLNPLGSWVRVLLHRRAGRRLKKVPFLREEAYRFDGNQFLTLAIPAFTRLSLVGLRKWSGSLRFCSSR